jgi:NADH-quinone oxidoreductase subunit J
MIFEAMLFYLFAAVMIGAALGVVFAKNPVHSVMFLVLTFFNSAILWLMAEAEFLAIVLVLVYVGAVMVLFLFVVMMLDVEVEQVRAGFTRYAPLGVGIVLLIVAQLGYVIWRRTQPLGEFDPPVPAAADYSNTEMLGNLLYTHYVYPFELAAVILLVAIVAAITLTMRRRPGLKAQDVSRQVAVRRQDRVRLVNMESEKDT